MRSIPGVITRPEAAQLGEVDHSEPWVPRRSPAKIGGAGKSQFFFHFCALPRRVRPAQNASYTARSMATPEGETLRSDAHNNVLHSAVLSLCDLVAHTGDSAPRVSANTSRNWCDNPLPVSTAMAQKRLDNVSVIPTSGNYTVTPT